MQLGTTVRITGHSKRTGRDFVEFGTMTKKGRVWGVVTVPTKYGPEDFMFRLASLQAHPTRTGFTFTPIDPATLEPLPTK